MVLPPCELAHDVKPQFTQTLVVKSAGGSSLLLSQWAASRVVTGAGAYAVVDMANGDVFVVLVMARAARVENAAENMKAEIRQLPGSPLVEWVRPLTRRLQRLFGWGDAASTSADVMRAAKAGDLEELTALVPQAASMIRRNEVEWRHLVTLHGASHGAPLAAPALEDREHEDREHEDREHEDREHEDAIPLRVVHEALGQHTWSEHPNRKAKCSHCEGLDAYECACGFRLCEQCRLPSAESAVGPSCSWRQHPTRPLPFYVIDHAKWPDDEKLA